MSRRGRLRKLREQQKLAKIEEPKIEEPKKEFKKPVITKVFKKLPKETKYKVKFPKVCKRSMRTYYEYVNKKYNNKSISYTWEAHTCEVFKPCKLPFKQEFLKDYYIGNHGNILSFKFKKPKLRLITESQDLLLDTIRLYHNCEGYTFILKDLVAYVWFNLDLKKEYYKGRDSLRSK